MPSNQPPRFQLTYRGLVTQIARNVPDTGFTRPDDLPRLTLDQLAAVLTHYPAALLEAMVEFDPTVTKNVRGFFAETAKDEDTRLALVGTVFVCALEQYVKPLVLRDVQMQVENNIVADRIERNPHSYDVLTADQLQAFELGVGRVFS